MNDIHILVTMPQHAVFRTFFDADAMAALEHIEHRARVARVDIREAALQRRAAG